VDENGQWDGLLEVFGWTYDQGMSLDLFAGQELFITRRPACGGRTEPGASFDYYIFQIEKEI